VSLIVKALDGPAAGREFHVPTCPTPVRVVLAADGTADILNLPEDAPRLDEAVHWYALRPVIAGHICGAGGCTSILHLEHAPHVRSLQAPDPVNPGAST
jgi:hypothetical protein